MIVCQPEDCENCIYDDCIGTIRQKRGRKPLSPEERYRRRLERSREYHRLHREEENRKNRERYHAKKKNS